MCGGTGRDVRVGELARGIKRGGHAALLAYSTILLQPKSKDTICVNQSQIRALSSIRMVAVAGVGVCVGGGGDVGVCCITRLHNQQ